jgi:hypothetical protein
MTTAVYRHCSDPYSIPRLYSNAKCVVEGFTKNRVVIRLLEFTRGHRPGDRLRVMRKNLTITGGPVPPPVDMSTVRLPYID